MSNDLETITSLHEENKKLKEEIFLLKSKLQNSYNSCLSCEKECVDFNRTYRIEEKCGLSKGWHRVMDNATYDSVLIWIQRNHLINDQLNNGTIRIKCRRVTNWEIANNEFVK